MRHTPKLFSRLCLGFYLVWLGYGGSFAAEAEDPAPTPQPELESSKPESERRPATQTPKKRSKHRSTTVHNSGPQRVEIGKDVHIAAGETVPDVVVIAANAIVDGTVDGNLVVLSGTAKVNGEVTGDLVTVLGSASLGRAGKVGQNAVIVGGPFRMQPDATVGGKQTVVAIPHVVPNFVWLQNWLANGLFFARPFPPQLKWVWVVGGLFLLVYLALTVMFPRPVQVCVEALQDQPVASFVTGSLLLVLIGPIVFLLAVSVAGILLIPFLICALLAAGLLGKVAVYSYAGQQVGRQMHSPNLALPVVLLIGVALFYLLYMVPVLGFAVWGIVTLVGLGAVLLAAFGSFRRESAPLYGPAQFVGGAPTASPAMPAPAFVTEAPPQPLTASDVLLLPRVGFWRRLVATLLDFVLLGWIIIHTTGPLFPLGWAAYFIAMWSWKGTTVGGIIMRIKIVRVDGTPIDFAVALVRSLSSFFSAIALGLGFFWAGWDKERQAWHDKIAGTMVVRYPKGVPLI